jgi:hypothetical protein
MNECSFGSFDTTTWGAMRFAPLIRLHGEGVDDVEGVSHDVRHSRRTQRITELTADDNIIAVTQRS